MPETQPDIRRISAIYQGILGLIPRKGSVDHRLGVKNVKFYENSEKKKPDSSNDSKPLLDP